MKCLILTIACAVLGCSSSSGGAPSLDGTWFYVNSTTNKGLGVTFRSDGSYTQSFLRVTTMSTADAQIDTGVFTSTATTITFTPKESSCPGPDSIQTMTYMFNNGNLELSNPSGLFILQPDTDSASMAAIAVGCYDSTGTTFTPSPLAPVAN